MTPRARLLAAVVLAAAVVAGCGVGAGSAAPVTFPPTTFGPAGTPGAAVQATRDRLAEALGRRGIQVDDPQVPYRPAEAAAFAGAPRSVIQAVLPRDPSAGYISIYGFADPGAAAAAAEAQAEYVGSPIGRVQFPTGTQFLVRLVGSTVVFYSAVPGASPDPLAAEVAGVLATVGTDVPVPR